MANIGEALTTRLAREWLEAIKKFLPVRDSVRQKLQLRQQVKEGFTEDVEELFKPVTKVTEAVKTAIVGKPDPTDPDKPQQSLIQAIEQLKKEQPEPIKGFNYKTDIRDDDIRNIPSMTFKETYEFGKGADSAYHSRELFLKNPDQKVDTQRFLDGLYKLNKGIDRLDTSNQFYIRYMIRADKAHSENKGAKRTKREKKLKNLPHS